MAYIYLHRRNDTGEVFYVGKGSGKRAWKKSDRNPHWHNVVNKAGYTVEIIAKGLTDEEAFWVEPLLIEAHGGVQNLTNMQEGGKGFTSEDAKRLWEDPEYREKMSQSMKETWSDPERREMRVQSRKEMYKDPEYRKKMSQASKEMWKDPEHRAKISQANKRRLECDRCGRLIGITHLKRHHRGPHCYNSVTKTP